MLKVCKFGGSSLATRQCMEEAARIVTADSSRKYVVVSAPGARFKGDPKVTDLLIRASEQGSNSNPHREVEDRIYEIVHDNRLLVNCLCDDLSGRFVRDAPGYLDGMKAFGEFSSAEMMRHVLEKKGVPARVVTPKEAGLTIVEEGFPRPSPVSYSKMRERLVDGYRGITIFPGFYGYDAQGVIKTFRRGGSDTTLSCVARAVDADIGENFTDVDGLYVVDPRIVPGARVIPRLTTFELRELAYAEFKVESASLEPLAGTRTVLNVRNTGNLKHPGTLVSQDREVNSEERIVGIAKQDGLNAITLWKAFIEAQVGFGEDLFGVLARRRIPYEHNPNGVDITSVVLDSKYLQGDNRLEYVRDEMKRRCSPDRIEASDRFSLVSVAGLGMKNHPGVFTRTFSVLEKLGIFPEMIDMGPHKMSIFIGVPENKARDVLAGIYHEFYG